MTSNPENDMAREALDRWDANVAFWDSGVGQDGNKYWTRLQEPCLQRLLKTHLQVPRKPVQCLELACGNGLSSRWLASQGPVVQTVLATNGVQRMVEHAERRGNCDGKITFQKANVTDENDLERIKAQAEAIGGFEIVLLNMAIMDIPTLGPLAKVLPSLLSEKGVFVATTLHPVFMTSTYSRNIQYMFDPATGEPKLVRSKAIIEYRDATSSKSCALPGQDTPHISFHRSMTDLFAPFLKAGLVLDALEEPSFTEDDAMPSRSEATVNFTQLPPILAFRLRRR